jgi:type II secretion system protein N
VTDSSLSPTTRARPAIPVWISIALALLLIVLFVALLFPWDSLARRVTYELARASGGRIEVAEIGPALTPRGPVLRARVVTLSHPAFQRVEVRELEIAPRLSSSWLRGGPALRIWADSELGVVDGVVELGSHSTFAGRVSSVRLEKLPLRLEASDLAISGELDAEADVSLDPSGVLLGRIDFTSPDLVVHSTRLPMALSFNRASGGIEILEDGGTRIDSVVFEGDDLSGEISGDIGLVHRSASPPIDIDARLQILSPLLRQLAPNAGLDLSRGGETSVRIRGTLESPEVESGASGERS